MQIIHKTMKPHGFTRSIMSLFRSKKPLTTFDRRPDDYYKHIYIDKPFFEAIDFLAKANHKSKKQMTHELLDLGISRFLGTKIAESNLQRIADEEQGKIVRPTYFMVLFRQWAKKKGFDISKFL